jgi:Zn-dependent M28 family amino/carboxypeptidase
MHPSLKGVLLSSFVALASTGSGWAIDPIDTDALVKAVTVDKIKNHLEQLQAIAARHGNTRALGTRGYEASVRYVATRLANAGYDVHIQPFTADLFEELSPPVLERTAPGQETYRPNVDFATMTYSGAGDVTAPLALARRIVIPPTQQPSSQSGCRAADFPSSVAGKIVLVQRGTCTFFEKADFAAQAGAVGVIIFNEGNPGRRDLVVGTLGEELPIPVVGTTFQLGRDLYDRIQDGQNVRIHLAVDAETTPVDTFNVIGEMRGRVNDQIVVVGAHLDSVPAGAGINDNGSGSAVQLTVAEEMAALGIEPRNTVRFAFWGAEEEGLFGSTFYVNNLGPNALERIGLNLNFDMLGSRNFVRFVYDGDGTIGDAGPPGSDVIEEVFVDFFDERGQASDPTLFDGRSDYQAFILNGIPAGGLFSGAEGLKTARQERLYGGKAGRPYDSCYHEPCDDLSNVSNRALRDLGKAAAHAVLTFAQTREDIRTRDRTKIAAARARALAAEYRGPYQVR